VVPKLEVTGNKRTALLPAEAMVHQHRPHLHGPNMLLMMAPSTGTTRRRESPRGPSLLACKYPILGPTDKEMTTTTTPQPHIIYHTLYAYIYSRFRDGDATENQNWDVFLKSGLNNNHGNLAAYAACLLDFGKRLSFPCLLFAATPVLSSNCCCRPSYHDHQIHVVVSSMPLVGKSQKMKKNGGNSSLLCVASCCCMSFACCIWSGLALHAGVALRDRLPAAAVRQHLSMSSNSLLTHVCVCV